MPIGRLYVEGPNDLHLLRNLLNAHDIDARRKGEAGPGHVEIIDTGGFDQLVRAIGPEVKSQAYPVGFVADADPSQGLHQRWVAITNPMKAYSKTIPPKVPAGGWVEAERRAGVWLMPDNVRDGTLENFLMDLIGSEDALWTHAVASTATATEYGAPFRAADREKAEVCTWLSWRDPPGLRYGEAVSSGAFNANAELACKFVEWFKSLYGL